jgi:hypothetical protein
LLKAGLIVRRWKDFVDFARDIRSPTRAGTTMHEQHR